MEYDKNTVLICNCENTMKIDGEKLAKSCGTSSCNVYSNLCNQELSVVEEELIKSKENNKNLSIACTQELKTFEALAEEKKLPFPKTFNIRELSGWSKEGHESTPKMSAIIKHSLEKSYPTPSLNLISHGRCLVYFEYKNNQSELDEVKSFCEKLTNHLGITLLISNYQLADFEKNISYQLCKGEIVKVNGYFSNFTIIIDKFSEFKASSFQTFILIILQGFESCNCLFFHFCK